MAQQNGKCSLKPAALSAQCFYTGRKDSSLQSGNYHWFLEKQFLIKMES